MSYLYYEKVRKKNMLLLVLIVILVGLLGCNSKAKEVEIPVPPETETRELKVFTETDELIITQEQMVRFIPFEEAVITSYCIVNAKLDKVSQSGTLMEYTFRTNAVLKNENPGETFIVYESVADVIASGDGKKVNYTSGSRDYQTGKDYILILEKHISVYNDQNYYMIVGDVYMPIENGVVSEAISYNESIEGVKGKKENDVSSYFAEMIDENNKYIVNSLCIGNQYIRSNNKEEIVNGSTYIVKVKVTEVFVEGKKEGNRDTYLCQVIHEYKGKIKKTFNGTEDTIIVTLFRNTVTVGDECLLLINDVHENSLMYELSSKNSCILMNDSKNINEYLELIE